MIWRGGRREGGGEIILWVLPVDETAWEKEKLKTSKFNLLFKLFSWTASMVNLVRLLKQNKNQMKEII